jgi:hypothetical protein
VALSPEGLKAALEAASAGKTDPAEIGASFGLAVSGYIFDNASNIISPPSAPWAWPPSPPILAAPLAMIAFNSAINGYLGSMMMTTPDGPKPMPSAVALVPSGLSDPDASILDLATQILGGIGAV